jgi:hypothetical protein
VSGSNNIINGGGGSADGSLPVFTAIGVTTISELTLEGQATDVILEAADGIVLENLADNQLTMSGLVNGESITLRMTGTGDITFQDIADEIRTSGGDINLEALGTGNLANIDDLTSIAGNGGDISLTSTNGNVYLQGLVQSTGTTSGDVFITAGGSVTSATPVAAVQANRLKILAGTGISLDVAGTTNRIQQLTASNTTSGNINFTNSFGLLTLAPNATAFAVSNTASNGFITIEATGIGAALTTAGLVQAPTGTGNQLLLKTLGLLTIGAGSNVQTLGTVSFIAADQDIQAPVSASTIEVKGFAAGNLLLGAANAIGNGTLELSQADIS